MNNLLVFENQEVEVINLNGKILFNPYHVGRCLGLGDSAVRMAMGNMSEKQAILVTNANVNNLDIRKMHSTGEKFLTESGLYKLIFKSRKPEAERFTDWVTDEVLPSIRKTGRYESKAPQKKSLRILDLRGLKVISNTDIANYFGVANATIASHAKAIGEYGILLEGAEMRRFKSENPNLPKSTSSMIVYSLSVAESICKRLGEEVTLRPTKVPTLPPPYPSTPSVTGDLDGALAAFNYIVREAQRLSNPDLRKAHLTVLMGVYVAISHMLKTA